MAGITEDSLISEFVAESRDHLVSLEPDLLTMEQDGSDVSSEVVNRAFRAIHSIKGSSSVLGFDSLMKLTHIMENVLMLIRNKKMVPASNNIDALLQSADKVSFMIDDVHASNQVNYDAELERLNEILNIHAQTDPSAKDTQPAPKKAALPKESPPSVSSEKTQVSNTERTLEIIEPEILADTVASDESKQSSPFLTDSEDDALLTDDVISTSEDMPIMSDFENDLITPHISLTDKGMVHFDMKGPDHFVCDIHPDKILNSYTNKKVLYAVWVFGTSDLVNKDRGPEEFLNDMISFGTYLFSDFADEQHQQDQVVFHIILSSILEKELLETAIDIPKEQIYTFPNESINKVIQKIKESPKVIPSTPPKLVQKKSTEKISSTETRQPERVPVPDSPPSPSEKISPEPSAASIVVSKNNQDAVSGYTRASLLKSGTGLRLEASGADLAIFEIDNSKIESLLAKKKKLFVIWVHPQKDLDDKDCDINELLNDMKSLGECITHDFDRIITDPKTQYYHMLVSSIMEKDLLCNGLDFPKNQMSTFSTNDLTAALSGNSDSEKIHEPDKSLPSPSPSDLFTKADYESMRRKEPAPNTSVIPSRKNTQSSQGHITETIRVPVDLIDRLMNLAGELVLGRNQLRQEVEEKVADNPRLVNVMQNVNLVTSEIQENIMRMRMQPLSSIFNKFPRVVRDIARQLYKKAEIIIDGGEVELDKSILENLSDPLTHIIRNSLDHGIEPTEVRIKNDKSETGLIHLTAMHEGSQVIITVSDNGRGIDADALVEKAINTNLVTQEQVARMSVKQKINLIFLPGFSTAKTVSDISGRGVGMDVVKTNIEKLGGHVDLESTVGKGTVVIIRLPLTLSIIPSLIVGSSEHIFAIPQINVQELVSIKASEVAKRLEKVGDATVLRLRERLLPMVWLNDVLGLDDESEIEPIADSDCTVKTPAVTENGNRFLEVAQLDSLEKNVNIVVLRVGNNSFGLAVNQLFDNEEIVVKPLSRHIKDCKCFSGSTIMGDGRVAMILDTAGIADFAFLRFAEISAEERRRREQEERDKKAASKRKPILLFNNALDEYFGLPLSNISRLELITRDSIQLVGQREFVNYNGRGLPLIRLENFLAVNPLPELDELYLIIPKTNGPMAGIMVSRIINILDIQEDIARDAYTPKGFLGSGFIEGYLTFFLDPDAVLRFLDEEGL
ncbi:MAG: chemotaxis protein CheW [Candidatus Magnetomorum sp.]|nr:chemotaxis protein CheW [Candidatus Magnetomorum sp.]